MLNPSTADEQQDDPTIRRCIGYARAWGYAELEVLNLFAWRSTDPRDLHSAVDPVGPDNDFALSAQTGLASRVVAAWGNHGSYRGRADAVRRKLENQGRQLFHLGLTQSGQPRHPLYLPAAVTLTCWSAA